jgi:hypothetical protein
MRAAALVRLGPVRRRHTGGADLAAGWAPGNNRDRACLPSSATTRPPDRRNGDGPAPRDARAERLTVTSSATHLVTQRLQQWDLTIPQNAVDPYSSDDSVARDCYLEVWVVLRRKLYFTGRSLRLGPADYRNRIDAAVPALSGSRWAARPNVVQHLTRRSTTGAFRVPRTVTSSPERSRGAPTNLRPPCHLGPDLDMDTFDRYCLLAADPAALRAFASSARRWPKSVISPTCSTQSKEEANSSMVEMLQ